MMNFFLWLVLGLSTSVHAEVFTWQDLRGRQHYSDQADSKAKPLDIKPGFGYQVVKTVFDGDTLVLADGQKVRLLGINTPEVQHRNQLEQAGAEDAKQWLLAHTQHTRVRLEMGEERLDKYNRLLAHVFTEKNEHLNLQLVAEGLATMVIYPTNLLYVNELTAAENKARLANKGLWGRAEYAPVQVTQVSPKDYATRQWLRLQGEVTAIRFTKKYVYLELSPEFDLRIEQQWLSLFPDLASYQHKKLEARGWINHRKGHQSMLIRHPSALNLVQ
ncbi:MAG: thermonuclease family protein [Methylovulum sp.]|jgi:micrococcal nuclease